MFGRTFAIMLTLAAASAALPAAAEQPLIVEGQPPATLIRIGYSDLNLATAQGRAALDARVRSAARQLCVEPGVTGLWYKMHGKQCLTQTLAAARPQVRQAVADFNTIRFADAGTIDVAIRR